MTDTTKLMPGPELDAMIHTQVLGRTLISQEEAMAEAKEVWKQQPRCEVFFRGFYAHLENGVPVFDGWAVPKYSTSPTACADVERWLVEHVPTHDILDRLHRTCDGMPSYVVGYATYSKCWYACFELPIDYEPPSTLWTEVAKPEETDSDPIAARMLAVCRFAVRVAMELKRAGKGL